MPMYDPTGHVLLKPCDLTDAELAANADAAEIELGLAGTSFTGTDAAKATLAVVLWLNCILKPEDSSDQVVKRHKEGDQEVEYAVSSRSANDLDECSRAKQLAAELLASDGAGAWEPLLTVR